MKWQLLHRACFDGDAAEVTRLLDAGANPNQVAPTNWRQTPLGRTLEFRVTHPKHAGHVEVVRCLLATGADPSVRSTQLDMTPFELASFCGLAPAAKLLRAGHAKNFAAADLLLAHGANPNAGISILHTSCDWHFEHLTPALCYLARNGWDVNAHDDEGQTAAHKAALLGYSAALRTLRELGADLAASDTNGHQPIDFARRWRKAAAIKELSKAA